MTVSQNHLTKDFLTTFFVANKAISKMLSEVLKNRNNPLFLEALGIPSDFSIPFFQEEGKTSFKQRLNARYETTMNGRPCNDHVIQSGDYFIFKNNDKVVKVLFVAVSDIDAGYKKYKLSKNTNVFIGRTPENQISCNFTAFISREKHAAIRIDDQGNAFIEDLKRSVGIYVNGYLAYSQQLRPFDEIFMMGLSIVYMGDFIAVRGLKTICSLPLMTSFAMKTPIDDIREKKYFISTPRIVKSLDQDEIEIDAPPSPSTVDKTPGILVFGPSLTMALVMLASFAVSISNAVSGGSMSTVIASGVMAVGMLLGSLMWPALIRNYTKRKTLAEEQYRKEKYSAYIKNIEQQLSAKRDRAVRVLNDTQCPSPDILSSMLDNDSNKRRLWERSSRDEDFLDVRIGLGIRPFEIRLKCPKQGFQLYDDELRDLLPKLQKDYATMENVPLTLDLKNNPAIGMIGAQKNINVILNEIILNIIALHSYDEAKLVIVTSPKRAHEFEFLKNVPHVRSNDKKVRFFATTTDEAHFIFNTIDETLKDRKNTKDKSATPIPHYVVIVTDPNLIEKESFVRYMDDTNMRIGLTTIFAYGDIAKIPKFCKTIIQSDNSRTGYYIKNENANKFIDVALDSFNINKMHSFANKLSCLPIKRDYRSMGIVDRISFLQMYKAGNVDELNIESHWDHNNSEKSLAAPIGVIAGGEVFELDLHESYHGCHGLVAGTTGSGKSEFLQALILSLAINYSPNEVAFVLVDFKGGDMARPFIEKPFSPALPHLSATISNLSGNTLYRALVSLEAEIKSRENIFNEAADLLGVDKLDINSYHKYYKSGRLTQPLPHLIIVIDEFAQLKTQHPEFLNQLINVAQVGRSLGIHLILATQKPSGIVDPQIMSNSRFKVCLKVAEKQDSIDMINRPDSALIKNPGRLYLQVGYDEVYECMQSGYSGADYTPTKTYVPDEEITVQMTDNTSYPIHSAKLDLSTDKSNKKQLEAIVSEIVSLGQKKGLATKPLWLDTLPEKIVLKTLARGKKGLCSATIGLADYVRKQEQKPITIDFAKTGHIGLYGASGMGKTTFLQTLVYSMVCEYGYTPEELNLYAMDFGGRNLGYLSTLPHTGGVVFADEENKVYELASLLRDLIDERKRIFAANNCGTFSDYRSIGKTPLPAVLVLIDNYASFRDKYMDVSDELIEVIGSGSTFGVYFVITGSTRNSIYYKVTEYISSYFALKMNDPGNYFDIFNERPPVIPDDISGRGITVVNKEIIEFQTAIAYSGENESKRLTAISKDYSRLAANWTGYTPVRLDGTIDESNDTYEALTLSSYSSASKINSPEAVSDNGENLILGVSKTGALNYGITLSDDYKVCACADNLTKLKDFYRSTLSNMVQHENRRVVFIDDGKGTFENIANECLGCHYINDTIALDDFIEDLKPQLNDRLEKPDGQHEQLFIVISEFNAFFDMITNEQAAFMRKVFLYIDSPQYQIYFVCGFDVSGEKNNDGLFMSLVVNADGYVLCQNSYELASQKIENLPIIPDVKSHSCYFCLNGKNIEVRW